MMNLQHGSDDELDRLLRGRADGPRGRLAGSLEEIRAQLPEDPEPSILESHMSQITAAAVEAAHSPVLAPAAGAGWRARGRRVLGLTVVKVGLSMGAAAAATATGLASTGNLPDPVQRSVAEVADRIGIHLPLPAVDGDAPSPEAEQGVPAETDGDVPRVDAPPHRDPADGEERSDHEEGAREIPDDSDQAPPAGTPGAPPAEPPVQPPAEPEPPAEQAPPAEGRPGAGFQESEAAAPASTKAKDHPGRPGVDRTSMATDS